jgi:adenosylcobinamide-phosphate guanylyltransferase
MCGGRGTRLDGVETEKPLVRVDGEPMLDRVVAACEASSTGPVHAVVSPHAPATRERASDLGLPVVDAPGEGYVADLGTALEAVGRPAVTVAADLPLLPAAAIDRALAACGDGDRTGADSGAVGAAAPTPSLAVCVPAALKRRLGATCETTLADGGRELAPTGLNVAGTGPDRTRVSWDARLAVNVNRPGDLDLAEVLA